MKTILSPSFVAQGLSPIASALPSQHERIEIASGNRGTAQTIALMQKMVARAKRDNRIRELAGRIIYKCESKDYHCYAKALYEYCRDEIRYAYDPFLVEYIEHPWAVVQNRIADCDSICMLLAALYEQIGLQSRFVTIKADAKRPDEFSHVYLQVKLPREGWVSADPTMPKKQFGWEAEGNYPRKNWPASTDVESDEMSGLSGPHHHHRRSWSGSFGWGYPYWGYQPPVVIVAKADGTLPTTDDVAIVDATKDDMDAVAATMAGMGGVRGLGASPADMSYTQMAQEILSGTMYDRLKAMRTENQDATGRLYTLRNALAKMPEGSAKTQAESTWTKAQAEQLKATNATNDAINKYNAAVEYVITQSGATIKPRHLGDLGIAPAAIVGLLLASAVFLAFASSFVTAFKAKEGARSFLGDVEAIIRSTGVVIEQSSNAALKVALVAAFGAAVWYFWPKMKAKRG